MSRKKGLFFMSALTLTALTFHEARAGCHCFVRKGHASPRHRLLLPPHSPQKKVTLDLAYEQPVLPPIVPAQAPCDDAMNTVPHDVEQAGSIDEHALPCPQHELDRARQEEVDEGTQSVTGVKKDLGENRLRSMIVRINRNVVQPVKSRVTSAAWLGLGALGVSALVWKKARDTQPSLTALGQRIGAVDTRVDELLQRPTAFTTPGSPMPLGAMTDVHQALEQLRQNINNPAWLAQWSEQQQAFIRRLLELFQQWRTPEVAVGGDGAQQRDEARSQELQPQLNELQQALTAMRESSGQQSRALVAIMDDLEKLLIQNNPSDYRYSQDIIRLQAAVRNSQEESRIASEAQRAAEERLSAAQRELNDMQAALEGIEGERDALRESLAEQCVALSEMQEEWQRQLRENGASHVHALEHAHEIKARCAQLQKSEQDLHHEVTRLKAKITDQESFVADQVQLARQLVAEEKMRAMMLQKQLEAMRAEVERVTREQDDAQTAHTQEVDGLRTQMQEQQEAAELAQGQYAELLAEKEKEMASLQQIAKALREQLRRLENERVETTAARASDAERHMSTLQQDAQNARAEAARETQLREVLRIQMADQLREKTIELQHLQEQLQQAQAQIADLQQKLQEAEKAPAVPPRSRFGARSSTQLGLLALSGQDGHVNQEVQPVYPSVLHSSSAGQLNTEALEALRQNARDVAVLREELEEKKRELQESETKVAALLQDLSENQIKQKEIEEARALVTQEKANAAVVRGEKEALQKRVAELAGELEAYNARDKEGEETLRSSLTKVQHELQQERLAHENEVSKLNGQQRESAVLINSLRQQLEKAQAEISLLQTQLEDTQTSGHTVLQKTLGELQASKAACAQLEKEIESLKQQLHAQGQEHDESVATVSRLVSRSSSPATVDPQKDFENKVEGYVASAGQVTIDILKETLQQLQNELQSMPESAWKQEQQQQLLVFEKALKVAQQQGQSTIKSGSLPGRHHKQNGNSTKHQSMRLS